MFQQVRISVIISALVLSAACLQKDTRHTLYLSPDGSVGWVAEEAAVYSNGGDPGKRLAEEQAYIRSALGGTHDMAAALQALEPLSDVRTTVLRDERPFHVLTEAGFGRIDRVLQRLFDEAGVRSTASLADTAGESTLRLAIDVGGDLEGTEGPAAILLHDWERIRIVLTDGIFTRAAGFDVSDGVHATLVQDWIERAAEANGRSRPVELTLGWRRR